MLDNAKTSLYVGGFFEIETKDHSVVFLMHNPRFQDNTTV